MKKNAKEKKPLRERVRSFFCDASWRAWVYRIAFVISVCVFCYSAAQLLGWMKDNAATGALESEVHDLAQVTEITIPDEDPPEDAPDDYWAFLDIPYLGINFDDLIEKNGDTVGWVQVGGTTANYPVVQTGDNSYYLTHAFDGSYNAAGWLFADYRCNMKDLGRNTII